MVDGLIKTIHSGQYWYIEGALIKNEILSPMGSKWVVVGNCREVELVIALMVVPGTSKKKTDCQ